MQTDTKFLQTLLSPCVKSKAPGPSVVPAAKLKPTAAGHVDTTSPEVSTTPRLDISTYACR